MDPCTPRLLTSTILVAALVGPTGRPSLSAQGPPPPPAEPVLERLQASDAETGDLFACALALSDRTLLVGSLLDDDRGPDGWDETAKILGLDTAAGDRFGFSVDLEGARAVIGAPLSGSGGAAYRFERMNGAWSQTARRAVAPRAARGSCRRGWRGSTGSASRAGGRSARSARGFSTTARSCRADSWPTVRAMGSSSPCPRRSKGSA